MDSKKNTYLLIHPKDNVLVALRTIEKNTFIEDENNQYKLQNTIPAKHKFFRQNLKKGSTILMYGVIVGTTQTDIYQGEIMTTENVKHAAAKYQYNNTTYQWQAPKDIHLFKGKTFLGYHRKDGRVGTANYWLFIPTVFCENRNLDVIKECLQTELGYTNNDKYIVFTKQLIDAINKNEDFNTITLGNNPTVKKQLFKNIDGIKFLNHEGGCGGTRQDANTLSSLLAAYADHPNVAGITLLSLGCQHLQVQNFKDDLKKRNPLFDKPLFIFEQQAMHSEEDIISTAIKTTFKGLIEINKIERKPADLKHLCLGVKCGGSDGFSGISANPAVGYAADLLVGLGGKVLLAEFPELCGAEQNILDRCNNKTIAEKFIFLMESYNNLAQKVGSGFHMNPSPGNIKDGLITDAIKSMGAVQKGGLSPIIDVLDYTETATKQGLSLVCTPGNDVEATTGKAASGANIILFTTGLGTPTGNPICPVIKVSSNTIVAQKMNTLIDIDCGDIVDGNTTIQKKGIEILVYCIQVASGQIIPKTVLLNQDDFIPWKRGVSL